MEKEIKLLMHENKEIDILVNDTVKFNLKEDSRRITAQEIYDILDYKKGDSFSVKSVNENKIDPNVITFFESMLTEICDGINEIDLNENNPEDLRIDNA